MSNILQSPLLYNFLYPFLLIFFISFGILEKTSILGKNKKQMNALVSAVLGLIFIGAILPKIIVSNLIQFLGIALVVIFVGLLFWGFISGKGDFTANNGKKIHKIFVAILALALLFGILSIVGLSANIFPLFSKLFLFLFHSPWSKTFWTNAIIVGVAGFTIAIAVGWNPFKKKMDAFVKLKD